MNICQTTILLNNGKFIKENRKGSRESFRASVAYFASVTG
jgi:hypothetical protein